MDLYTISTDEAGAIMITDAAGDRGTLGILQAEGDAPEETISAQLGYLFSAVVHRDSRFHGSPAMPRDAIVRYIDNDGKVWHGRAGRVTS